MSREPTADREFMEALVRDEPGSLERIICKWERPLYSFAYRYTQNEFTTREIVQETFVRVFTKRAQYDFNYPLSSWIFTIAANLCKNRARWLKRHPEVSLEKRITSSESEDEGKLQDVLSSENEMPIDTLEHEEALQELKVVVMTLPHDLRTAILLHHYEDLSYKEIAAIVGCSVRGVETRLYRARKLLKSRLTKSQEGVGESQKKTASFEETVGKFSPYPST